MTTFRVMVYYIGDAVGAEPTQEWGDFPDHSIAEAHIAEYVEREIAEAHESYESMKFAHENEDGNPSPYPDFDTWRLEPDNRETWRFEIVPV